MTEIRSVTKQGVAYVYATLGSGYIGFDGVTTESAAKLREAVARIARER